MAIEKSIPQRASQPNENVQSAHHKTVRRSHTSLIYHLINIQ